MRRCTLALCLFQALLRSLLSYLDRAFIPKDVKRQNIQFVSGPFLVFFGWLISPILVISPSHLSSGKY